MQHDAVHTYHWMSNAQFLDAVALGKITPGPVVQTVAVVGYAAAGLGGGLLAALLAFTPSFAFVLIGGRHFDRLREAPHIQAFLTGAGAAAIGAIARLHPAARAGPEPPMAGRNSGCGRAVAAGIAPRRGHRADRRRRARRLGRVDRRPDRHLSPAPPRRTPTDKDPS